MKRIRLSRGMVALVDITDAHLVAGRSWYADPKRSTHYARAEITKDGARERLYMHRVIMKPPKGKVVDHINGDGLDNRRSNLRVVSYSRNGHNRTKHVNPHGHVGLSWDGARGRWKAQIMVNRKNHPLGRFKTKAEAIAARKRAERELL